jgi:hypothetical protein
LPESAALLQQVLQMHLQELAVKQQLLQCFGELVQEAGSCLHDGQTGLAGRSNIDSQARSNHSSSTSKAAGSGAGGRRTARDVEDCRKLLTAGITTWMVRPCIEEQRMDQLLQVLTDEMVGF